VSQLKEDHALLIEIVREGGALALSYFHSSVKHWDKGYGDPVSEADHAVDDLLRQKLLDQVQQKLQSCYTKIILVVHRKLGLTIKVSTMQPILIIGPIALEVVAQMLCIVFN